MDSMEAVGEGQKQMNRLQNFLNEEQQNKKLEQPINLNSSSDFKAVEVDKAQLRQKSGIFYEPINTDDIPDYIHIDTDANYGPDYIKENNRQGALDNIGTLNNILNFKLNGLLDGIKNATNVNFTSSQKDLTIVDKRNYALENNNTKQQVMNLISAVSTGLTVYDFYISAKTGGYISPENTFLEQLFEDLITHPIENALDTTATKYADNDKQGDKIGEITQVNMDIQYSAPAALGKTVFTKANINYEYHIVNGVRRILSVSVNDRNIYNDYQN